MSRKPDPATKDRILKAAVELLRRSGEKGLSLRAVATAAGTTTATVYKRFQNREALILAIANRERQKFVRPGEKYATLEEVCRWYLEYAATHKHEYRLIFGSHWVEIFATNPEEPVLDWAKQQFAKRFGGKPQQYDEVARWLRMLLHGAASLLVNSREPRAVTQVRALCLRACDSLIASAHRYKSR